MSTHTSALFPTPTDPLMSPLFELLPASTLRCIGMSNPRTKPLFVDELSGFLDTCGRASAQLIKQIRRKSETIQTSAQRRHKEKGKGNEEEKVEEDGNLLPAHRCCSGQENLVDLAILRNRTSWTGYRPVESCKCTQLIIRYQWIGRWAVHLCDYLCHPSSLFTNIT